MTETNANIAPDAINARVRAFFLSKNGNPFRKRLILKRAHDRRICVIDVDIKIRRDIKSLNL